DVPVADRRFHHFVQNFLHGELALGVQVGARAASFREDDAVLVGQETDRLRGAGIDAEYVTDRVHGDGVFYVTLRRIHVSLSRASGVGAAPGGPYAAHADLDRAAVGVRDRRRSAGARLERRSSRALGRADHVGLALGDRDHGFGGTSRWLQYAAR